MPLPIPDPALAHISDAVLEQANDLRRQLDLKATGALSDRGLVIWVQTWLAKAGQTDAAGFAASATLKAAPDSDLYWVISVFGISADASEGGLRAAVSLWSERVNVETVARMIEAM